MAETGVPLRTSLFGDAMGELLCFSLLEFTALMGLEVQVGALTERDDLRGGVA